MVEKNDNYLSYLEACKNKLWLFNWKNVVTVRITIISRRFNTEKRLLCAKYCSNYLTDGNTCTTPEWFCEVGILIIIFLMRKLRHKKVRLLAQGLRAKKWWIHALIPDVWLPRPCCYPLYQLTILKVYLKFKKSPPNTLMREINAIRQGSWRTHFFVFLPTSPFWCPSPHILFRKLANT